MKKAPSIIQLNDLMEMDWPQEKINGRWSMLRPMGFYSIKHRVRCAWLVFTGKADVLLWIPPSLVRHEEELDRKAKDKTE